MAINAFVPSIWASALLRSYDKALTYSSAVCVSRSYEGEIKDFGDRVKIGSIGDVTIFDYVPNQDMTPAETLAGTTQDLVIDRVHGFNFQVDDLDAAQIKPEVMGEATRKTTQLMKQKIDAYIAGLMVAGATGGTLGTVGAPITPTKDTAYELIVDAASSLTGKDVPNDNSRFVVVSSAFHGLLLKDPRFVRTDDVRDNGLVGRAAGMDILVSTQVPSPAAGKVQIVAGHRDATQLALQVVKVEAYSPEKRFAKAVKGLTVYGAKVTRPTSLVVINSTI